MTTVSSEFNKPNEQDNIDAERYRWLASRVKQGLLTLYDTTTGTAKPWANAEFETTIDKGVRLEQQLKDFQK